MVAELFLALEEFIGEMGKIADDLGDIKFRTPDGTEISNTAVISRGYKSGYNGGQTKWNWSYWNNLEMVEMVTLKRWNKFGGGGGGQGYTDGSVTVVQTSQGGNWSSKNQYQTLWW